MNERLEIIEEMIQKTRQNMRHSGRFFLLWGWIILLACSGQFLLDMAEWYAFSWVLWAGAVALGAILSIITLRRYRQESGVKTYADSAITSVWFACGIGMVMVAFIGVPLKALPLESLVLLIAIFAGVGVFATGRIIELRSLQISGALWWVAALIMMFIPWEYHILALAITIIPGYLIPGYLINAQTVTTS